MSNLNGLEIEKKFLIPRDKIPINLESYKHDEIEQGYLFISSGKDERIRRWGNKYYHTTKIGEGEVRYEDEKEITKNDFFNLWPQTEGRRIQKTRYLIPYLNRTIELDIYHGKNEGLIVAEIEFDNKDTCDNFHYPEWFGEDITDKSEFKNKNLAG